MFGKTVCKSQTMHSGFIPTLFEITQCDTHKLKIRMQSKMRVLFSCACSSIDFEFPKKNDSLGALESLGDQLLRAGNFSKSNK